MTNTLFISETKLKSFTDINNNVDDELIKNAVRESQDIEIQRILGTKLYKALIDGIINNTLTGDETTLLNDYVADALTYWAYYYCLDSIYMKPRNNGLIRSTGGENSEAADLTLYDRKRKTVQSKADWYAELLATYLVENKDLFPELSEITNGAEKGANLSSKYSKSPFVMRNSGRCQSQWRGLPIANSAYPYLPPYYGYNNENGCC